MKDSDSQACNGQIQERMDRNRDQFGLGYTKFGGVQDIAKYTYGLELRRKTGLKIKLWKSRKHM